MKLIELHILQSFPVSCLNRDDVGAPKSAVFGGVSRARISSQCLKRAIRDYAKSNLPAACFNGQRTKLLVPALEQRLIRAGFTSAGANEFAKLAADYLSGLDDEQSVKTLTFLSPAEFDSIAQAIAAKKELKALDPKIGPAREERDKDQKQEKKDAAKIAWDKLTTEAAKQVTKETVAKAIKQVALKDAADIALFGRMVASEHSLTVEGAAMFSHALSTHRADNDIDFYSAVDEAKPKGEDAGAGMIGTLEFTSAVYYRYAGLNLDMLADSLHLGALEANDRKKIVDAFIRATLMAIPTARHNSMNANTPPDYVLGIYKEHGQPMQLINAFEEPVWSRSGLLQPSVRKALLHQRKVEDFLADVAHTKLATGTYQPKPDSDDKSDFKNDFIPEHVSSLGEFAKRLSAHAI